MKREEVLMHLVRIEADLSKLREALQADLKGEQHVPPEDFKVEESNLFDRNNPPTKLTDEQERGPEGRSVGDMATPRQLGMIRAVAREAGIDAERECLSLNRCKPEDLSKASASLFIDHLTELKRQGRIPA